MASAQGGPPGGNKRPDNDESNAKQQSPRSDAKKQRTSAPSNRKRPLSVSNTCSPPSAAANQPVGADQPPPNQQQDERGPEVCPFWSEVSRILSLFLPMPTSAGSIPIDRTLDKSWFKAESVALEPGDHHATVNLWCGLLKDNLAEKAVEEEKRKKEEAAKRKAAAEKKKAAKKNDQPSKKARPNPATPKPPKVPAESAIRVELSVNPEQKKVLLSWIGAFRWTYNEALNHLLKWRRCVVVVVFFFIF